MRALQGSGRITYLAPDGNLHVVDQAGRRDEPLSLDAGPSQDRRAHHQLLAANMGALSAPGSVLQVGAEPRWAGHRDRRR